MLRHGSCPSGNFETCRTVSSCFVVLGGVLSGTSAHFNIQFSSSWRGQGRLQEGGEVHTEPWRTSGIPGDLTKSAGEHPHIEGTVRRKRGGAHAGLRYSWRCNVALVLGVQHMDVTLVSTVKSGYAFQSEEWKSAVCCVWWDNDAEIKPPSQSGRTSLEILGPCSAVVCSEAWKWRGWRPSSVRRYLSPAGPKVTGGRHMETKDGTHTPPVFNKNPSLSIPSLLLLGRGASYLDWPIS